MPITHRTLVASFENVWNSNSNFTRLRHCSSVSLSHCV